MSTSNPPNQVGNPAAAIPVYIGFNAIASDGVGLPLDSLAQTFTYNGSNQELTDTVTYKGNTYVRTKTYTGGNLTGVSIFVKQ